MHLPVVISTRTNGKIGLGIIIYCAISFTKLFKSTILTPLIVCTAFVTSNVYCVHLLFHKHAFNLRNKNLKIWDTCVDIVESGIRDTSEHAYKDGITKFEMCILEYLYNT